jgi:hypothetical protein
MALYEAGVDVVVNGHDHDYERFAPQNPSGGLDLAHGIREFVVGTGGAALRDFDEIQNNSEIRNDQTWGVLQLTLNPDSYAWKFMPIDGQGFVEGGSAQCVTEEGDWLERHYLPALHE